jgi:GMP synthase (glutamine-hydrolysing)
MSERPILVVKTGEALAPVKARYGDFEEWIARGLGLPLTALAVASVHLGEVLPDVAEVGGVVVTGSPAMVTERSDWSEAAAAWLADVVRADALPVLGLCYGHQLVAHGLGGEVGPNPKGREMGTVEVTFADAPAAGSIFERGAFPGHMSHVESVLRPPAGARVLAESPIDPHSVLAFGPRQWGVQFHPEFDAAIMRGYVEARREVLLDEGLDPDAMIAGVVETPALTGVLARFAEVVQRA